MSRSLTLPEVRAMFTKWFGEAPSDQYLIRAHVGCTLEEVSDWLEYEVKRPDHSNAQQRTESGHAQ